MGYQHVEYKAGDELRSASYPYVSVMVYVPRSLEGSGKIPSSDISRTVDEVLENSSKSLIKEVILYAPENYLLSGARTTNPLVRYFYTVCACIEYFIRSASAHLKTSRSTWNVLVSKRIL